MTNNPLEAINDLVPVLQNNLNATEIVLAKFNTAMRTVVVQALLKNPNLDKEGIQLVMDTAADMQSDFTKFKSGADMFLAILAQFSK